MALLVGILVPVSSADPTTPSPAAPGPTATSQPSGPHPVGRRHFVWRDETRADVTDPTRRREVPVTIWYPAAELPAGPAEPALGGSWGDRRFAQLEKKLGPALVADLREWRVSARTDAPLLRGDARLAVVLFAPGLGWLPTDYSVLVEDLASHGYVVVGTTPAGLADVVVWPDGRETRRSLGLGAAIGTDQVHLHEDARFVLRQALAMDADPTSFLRNRLDLARVGAFGHSLGGATAHVLAATEPTVRAALNIDGDPMGSVLDVRPTQPLMLVSSESPSIDDAPDLPSPEHRQRTIEGLERSERRRTADWARMSSASRATWRVRVQGTRHLNFEDAALFASRLQTRQERWMRVGPIDGRRGLTVTATLVRAFFDHTLRGQSDRLLRDPSASLPEARLDTTAAP